MVAAFKSEWVAGFKSEYPAGFIGIRMHARQQELGRVAMAQVMEPNPRVIHHQVGDLGRLRLKVRGGIGPQVSSHSSRAGTCLHAFRRVTGAMPRSQRKALKAPGHIPGMNSPVALPRFAVLPNFALIARIAHRARMRTWRLLSSVQDWSLDRKLWPSSASLVTAGPTLAATFLTTCSPTRISRMLKRGLRKVVQFARTYDLAPMKSPSDTVPVRIRVKTTS